MSVKEIGSLLLVGIYRDQNLRAGLTKIKTLLTSAKTKIKNTTVEMFRMAKQSKLLALTLGMIGVGGFASLLSMMPRVNAQLKLAKTYIKLIALELDDNFAPAVEWVVDKLGAFKEWFKGLPEWAQTAVGSLGILSMTTLPALALGFLSGKLKVSSFGKALSTLKSTAIKAAKWLGGIVTTIWEFIAGSVAAQITLGALVGIIAVFALDKAGFFEWISKMTQGFRDARDEGDLWAVTLTLLLSPIALLGDAILVLVGSKSWTDFKADTETLISSFRTLKTAVSDFVSEVRNVTLPSWFESAKSTLGIGVHDVGGMASYTGWHWLQAGETVNMRGVSPSSGSGSGAITISNTFTGPIVLNNGMDMDEFATETSRKQAEKMAWRSF